jgi:mRNA interferase RelE/StbE
MSYLTEWEQDASEALERLDARAIDQILLRVDWLSTNLDNIRLRALVGPLKGYFKLRAGDYRIVYAVNRTERLLIIHDVGHRKNVYKEK